MENTAAVSPQQLGVLLTVCFLSQLFIGTAQPYDMPAWTLILIALAGTLLQLGLFAVMCVRRQKHSRIFVGGCALIFCAALGYDIVKADRFYRTVTAQTLPLWWLALGIGAVAVYAVCCEIDCVARTGGVLLVLSLLSVAGICAVLLAGWQAQRLQQTVAANCLSPMMFWLEYSFPTELLLVYFIPVRAVTHKAGTVQKAVARKISVQTTANQEKAAAHISLAGEKPVADQLHQKPFRPIVMALFCRFIVTVILALVGEGILGVLFSKTPQVFGLLSLVSTGGGLSRCGVLFHMVWLTAVAFRAAVLGCILLNLVRDVLPKAPFTVCLGTGIAFTAALLVLWQLFWQQRCLTMLSGAVLLLWLAAMAGGRSGAKSASLQMKGYR